MAGWRKNLAVLGLTTLGLSLMPNSISSGTGGSNDSLNKNSGLEEKVEFQDNFSSRPQDDNENLDTVINGIELREPIRNPFKDDKKGDNRDKYESFYLFTSSGHPVTWIMYVDKDSDDEYENINISNRFTRNMAGEASVLKVRTNEVIGVSSPFDYHIKFAIQGEDGYWVSFEETERNNLYESNLKSRFPSARDSGNFLFGSRIKAIRNAYEAYAEKGRIKPTYDILYKEIQTWNITRDYNENVIDIDTGVPESINEQVIYPGLNN